MKVYTVEYLENGITYAIRTFTDFTKAMRFFNRIYVIKKEWARIS